MTRDILTETTPELFAALAEAAGKMEAIAKSETNQQQQFKFRSIEAIIGHAKPLLREAGVTIVPTSTYSTSEEVESSRGARGWRTVATITYRIGHKSGESITAEMVGEAVDYGDKSTTKAAQMAYKYLLTQLLGIGSDDPDAHSPDVGGKEELSDEEKMKLATNKLKAEAYTLTGEDKDEAARIFTTVLEAWNVDEPVPLDKVDEISQGMRNLVEEEAKTAEKADEKEEEQE